VSGSAITSRVLRQAYGLASKAWASGSCPGEQLAREGDGATKNTRPPNAYPRASLEESGLMAVQDNAAASSISIDTDQPLENTLELVQTVPGLCIQHLLNDHWTRFDV